jgi:hypothetical protein
MPSTTRAVRRILIRMVLIAAAAGLSLTGAFGSGAANAAPQVANIGVPDNSCGPSNAIVVVQGTRFNIYFCADVTVNTTGLGPFQILSAKVHNRIWFHQNANNTGWADCHQAYMVDQLITGRDQNPGNIQVSSNTAAC